MTTCNCPHCGKGIELRPATIEDVDLFGVPSAPQSTSASTTMLPDRFEEWWKLYPRKKGKVVCRKKWKARKLNERAEMLIGALMEQIEHDEEWKNGYAPNPETYINQDRWEDEVSYPVERVEEDADMKMIRAAQADDLKY